jgi:hypothetical protein
LEALVRISKDGRENACHNKDILPPHIILDAETIDPGPWRSFMSYFKLSAKQVS